MDNLIAHFSQYLPLNELEVEALGIRVVEKTIKRKQFILNKGDTCKHYSFVASGLLRKYAIDKNGCEFNIQFATENQWIQDLGSFNNNTPSQFYIEAIEPSVLFQLDKNNLLFLLQNFPKFDRNFRVIMENKFINLENRIFQNISLTAEEGYKKFLNEYPELYNRLPNTQIASYLGITPEFLSKVRRNISLKD